MLQAYKEHKDLYAVIAQSMFGNNYFDNLEFYPSGSKIIVDGQEIICGDHTHQNKAGKERRSQAKTVLLGLLYGRGANSIGEQIGKTFKEGQEIIDKFFRLFPKVHRWIDTIHEKVKKRICRGLSSEEEDYPIFYYLHMLLKRKRRKMRLKTLV